MRIFVTGATGFVGRALVLRLLRDGHDVVAWTRNPERAQSLLGPDVSLVAAGADLVPALRGCDAVVHLAGATIAARWTRAHRDRIRASRVHLARDLVTAMSKLEQRPSVFVSASAIGAYGADRGEERLDESSPRGTDFLGTLCRDWEAEVAAAGQLGVRTLSLRLGLVLGREGGVLPKLNTPASLGLGGPLGSGLQWMSWIHLRDLVELFVGALHDSRQQGVRNAVAPNPVRQAELMQALASRHGRPTGPAVPGFVLRLALGQASSMLLGSARVVPAMLQAEGVGFAFETIGEALDDLFDPAREPTIKEPGPVPSEVPRRPLKLLEQHTVLDAPMTRVFPFFGEARNLALLTPTWTEFRILQAPDDQPVQGTEIVYSLKLGPVPIRWRTRIAAWEPGERFVDTQLRGPYTLWWHEHRFEERDGRVHMVDRVWYRPILGPLGWVANKLFVERLLKRIFSYRSEAITLRFGEPARSARAA